MKKYPVLAFCGWGRAGKDTCAEWFRDFTPLRYVGGCSWEARTHVAGVLGLSVEQAWETRHQRRDDWYRIMNEYRRHDPARLVRECLQHSDIVCGVRDGAELAAAVKEGLISLTVWLDRPGVPLDATTTYAEKDCDVTVRNHGSVEDLRRKLKRLAVSLGIPVLP